MPIKDKSLYPTNWSSEIRPAILERANNCCEICGVENGRLICRDKKDKEKYQYWPEGMESEVWTLDGLKSTLIVLTIAHLDHNTENNDYSNLKALCQLHHLRHDIVFHKANSRKTRFIKSKQIPIF